MKFAFIASVTLFYLIYTSALSADKSTKNQYNGFDVSNASVELKAIESGGPPRDAIPAINNPVFIKPSSTQKQSDAPILGLNFKGIQKAYPLNILVWHEVVNDTFENQPVMISYCPLCASGIAFESDKEGFGVSGLLYDSDVLLYDRKTDSLWSQVAMQAISGPRLGEKLTPLLLERTTFKNWLKKYPNSTVLSEETGFNRDYQVSPYAGYEKTPHIFFKVRHQAPDFIHPKTLVLGVNAGGKTKAYPLSELAKLDLKIIRDRFNGYDIQIEWDKESQSAAFIPGTNSDSLEVIQLYWFAWYSFNPDTEVYLISKISPMKLE